MKIVVGWFSVDGPHIYLDVELLLHVYKDWAAVTCIVMHLMSSLQGCLSSRHREKTAEMKAREKVFSQSRAFFEW